MENWAASWRAQDIEKYMANYDIKFKTDKENYNQWKSKKTTLFSHCHIFYKLQAHDLCL